MFRLDSGAIAVIENVWCLPENAPFAIDARMEIIGTKGAIYIDNSGVGYTVLKKEGLSYPQSTYWPKVHGARRGFLKEELDYFTRCVLPGQDSDGHHAARVAPGGAGDEDRGAIGQGEPGHHILTAEGE